MYKGEIGILNTSQMQTDTCGITFRSSANLKSYPAARESAPATCPHMKESNDEMSFFSKWGSIAFPAAGLAGATFQFE